MNLSGLTGLTSALAVLPAKYAKFIAALVGALVLYLQRYGATWQLVPAVSAISAALAVAGVPNKVPVLAPPVLAPLPAPALAPPATMQ